MSFTNYDHLYPFVFGFCRCSTCGLAFVCRSGAGTSTWLARWGECLGCRVRSAAVSTCSRCGSVGISVVRIWSRSVLIPGEEDTLWFWWMRVSLSLLIKRWGVISYIVKYGLFLESLLKVHNQNFTITTHVTWADLRIWEYPPYSLVFSWFVLQNEPILVLEKP